MAKRLPPLLRTVLLGVTVGIVLGVVGGLRTRAGLGLGQEAPSTLMELAAFGAVAGLVGGLIYWLTGPTRRRGGLRFFLAWAGVGLGGLGAGLIPAFLSEPLLPVTAFWLVMGVGAGLGLALTERIIRS